MKQRKAFFTLIKRSHLVLQYGVGSVVRTRSGLTALVSGLPEWDRALRRISRDEGEVRKFRSLHGFREPELENATGVKRFLPPPALVDRGSQWSIPLLRFPLAGVCSNWQCNSVNIANEGTPPGRSWKCQHCKGRKYPVVQVPIFYACPDGHLDEIAWHDIVDHKDGCQSSQISVNFGSRVESPVVRCPCGGKSFPENVACSGSRPWLPGAANDQCTLEMEVVSRSSVKVYFPNTKSAIHIPVDAPLHEGLLEWLERGGTWHLYRIDTSQDRREVADAFAAKGYMVSPELAAEHIRFLRERDLLSENHWKVLDSRLREFEVLSGVKSYKAIEESALISLEHKDLSSYSAQSLSAGLVTGVTAVHKLTESRVLNGFSRLIPKLVEPRKGRLMMWGRDTKAEDWLPGYRSHGEGIFLKFDSTKFRHQGATESDGGRGLFELSRAGSWAHTFAHALVIQLAEQAGYSVPSIRDRIYDIEGGHLGILIYTAEGDSLGTLGGLVSHCEPGLLEPLLERTLEAAGWCAQDPVCRETPLDTERHISAACHQCALLPETSCELFNSYLDRNLLMDHSH
jgi:hypothetical protein